MYTRTDAGIVDVMAPEWLMGFLTTHKADIFSLGLIFWEVVMLRRLVEGRSSTRRRLVRDLAHRLGPIPDEIYKRWKDAEKFLDTQGRALSLLELEGEEEEEEPGPHDYDYLMVISGTMLNGESLWICRTRTWSSSLNYFCR